MGRGRPKGSKNRPKAVIIAEKGNKAALNRPRGRPKKTAAEMTAADKENDRTIARRSAHMAIPEPKTAEEIAWNSRLIDHIMGIHEIASHADRNDVMTLKSCFVAYLQLCQKNGFSVTNMAAYGAMGMSLDDFRFYCKRDDPEVREFCKLVKETCGMFRESLVQTGKLNPVIGIFWQRNYDGLRNDTEQIQNALEQDEDYQKGSKTYKEKYRNLIGE